MATLLVRQTLLGCASTVCSNHVDGLHHEEEDRCGNRDEGDRVGDERAVPEHGVVDREREIPKVGLTHDHRHDWCEQVVHEGRDERCERDAEDERDGELDNVSSEEKVSELLEHEGLLSRNGEDWAVGILAPCRPTSASV